MEKNSKVINGDPLTFEKKEYHIPIHWYDRVFGAQLTAYHDWSEENEHANEGKGWKEHLEQIVDEKQDADLEIRWWEYRGRNCPDDQETPLIICFDEYYNQSWQPVADANNLTVAAFEYHRNMKPPEEGLGALGFGPSMEEIRGYHCVVERIMEHYAINRKRVYLNGLSYGDMSALIYAKEYGDTLAAIVLMNGPSSWYNIMRYDLYGHMPVLPVLMLRSDSDIAVDGYPCGISLDIKGNTEWMRYIRTQGTLLNQKLWMGQMPEKTLPVIHSDGNRIFLKYDGGAAPVIYHDNNRRSHIAPVDYAQVMWDNLYRCYQRNDGGQIEQIGPDRLTPDQHAIALMVGSSKAYIDHAPKDLPFACYMVDPYPDRLPDHLDYGEEETRASTFYAPIELLETGFGIVYEIMDSEDYSNWLDCTVTDRITLHDQEVHFHYKDQKYVLYTNAAMYTVDGHVEEITRPLLILDGHLMIPVKKMAQLLGLCCDVRNDTAYVTDHPVSMGLATTRVIREVILAPELHRQSFSVALEPAEHGRCELSAQEIPIGETLKLRTFPEDGYETAEVHGYLNGLECNVEEVEPGYFWLCNVYGDVELRIIFRKKGTEDT